MYKQGKGLPRERQPPVSFSQITSFGGFPFFNKKDNKSLREKVQILTFSAPV